MNLKRHYLIIFVLFFCFANINLNSAFIRNQNYMNYKTNPPTEYIDCPNDEQQLPRGALQYIRSLYKNHLQAPSIYSFVFVLWCGGNRFLTLALPLAFTICDEPHSFTLCDPQTAQGGSNSQIVDRGSHRGHYLRLIYRVSFSLSLNGGMMCEMWTFWSILFLGAEHLRVVLEVFVWWWAKRCLALLFNGV